MYNKKTMVVGSSFWSVESAFYPIQDEDGKEYERSEFFYTSHIYHDGDDLNFNPERIFDNEYDAAVYAMQLSEEDKKVNGLEEKII